jgi:small-conductance mechanosensitive channel
MHMKLATSFHKTSKSRSAIALVFVCVFLLVSGVGLFWSPLSAQDANQNQSQLHSQDVVAHLNAVISWYRDVTTKAHGAGLPSDAIYQDNTQQLATQALQLAFQSARAEASLIDAAHAKKDAAKQGAKQLGAKPANPQPPASPQANSQPPASSPQVASQPPSPAAPSINQQGQQGSIQQQGLEKTLANIAAQILALQTQLDSINKEIGTAPASKRQNLVAQRDALQGQIDLNKAMQDAIGKMSSFLESSENSSEGLLGRVNELARSVPEALTPANPKSAKPAPAAQTAKHDTTGLWGEASALYDDVTSMHTMDQLNTETQRVKDSANQVRKPLRDTLAATIQRGRQIASQTQTPNQTSNPGQAAATQKDFQDLTAQFNQIADAAVPLAQEIVILDQTKSNLSEWRESMVREAEVVGRSLLARIITIFVSLVLILVLSEVWRRFTFRYVHDPRRRRQFLLLRRFAVGFLFAIVVMLGFVSEFSSLATFAGFITAGIAVSLQAVLLSVAAYFMLIGRYGIRVGDRISISGVTGDVVDIGLVRLHVMELAGTGVDLFPTGRIVVFSNSVLFQATTPLYKQIPGTEYAWHEVAVGLVPGGKYKTVQDKLLAAVTKVYDKYRGEIESQHRDVERRIEIEIAPPSPSAQLQFGDAGLEYVVRYPVEIRRSAQIDDEVTRAILEIIDQDAEVKAAVSGSPKIRAAVKG